MAFGLILVLWNRWNIRGFVMLSLWLQVFLILFAPLRKKTTNRFIITLLWLAYLMADWVVAFTVGLISHSSNSSDFVAGVDGALRAFWASFLLLHLGGPDTITAFSFEDSSLWQRHLLSLVFQVSSAIYVFVEIFPRDKSLMIPTILVFLAGLIKNVERTAALFFSSRPKLREWVFSQHKYPQDVSKLARNSIVSQLKSSNGEEVKFAESIMVEHAYYFFQMFKVLLGDLMFTSEERKVSREYFQYVSAMDAFRVISIELQLMYEVLHTKTLVIRSKVSYIFRFIAFTNVAMAFVQFKHLKKHQLPELDVEITYFLLFGGIALDVIALLMLVFSDWTIVEMKQVPFLNKLVCTMTDLRKPRFATCEALLNADVTFEVLNTPFIFRRWSESISACNLLSEFVKERPRHMRKRPQCWNICSYCGTFNVYFVYEIPRTITSAVISRLARIANTERASENPFIKKLWIFIFTEVKCKSMNADNAKEAREIFDAKGDLFLQRIPGIDYSKFSVYVTQPNFDASIIMWHIATEMWYNIDKPTAKIDQREFSKIISDYMMFLLLNRPNLVSTVSGIAQIRSGTMLEEMKEKCPGIVNVKTLCNYLCKIPLEHSTNISTLHEGIKLAQEMDSLGEKKWEVMSGVWVEMLSYTASHIQGETHVQVLCRGGELLAFVWLLMAHFGCFYKPEWGIYADYHRLE